MNDHPEPSPTRWHPLFSLIAARFREFCREPAAIFWVYVFPLIMVVALGVAFRDKPIGGFAVVIRSGDLAEQVRQTLERDGRFQVFVCDEQESQSRLRTGRVELLIVPSSDMAEGYSYYFDPTQEKSVLTRQMANEVLQQAAHRQDAISVHDYASTELGSRYIDFLVPGLLGMGLLGGGMWGVGFAIVDMRLRKLLKRYLATPMKRSHFLAAVMASRLLFTVPEVLMLLLFARIFFGVTSQGGYGALGLLILLGTFEFSGLGLLVACRAQTIETVSGLMNAVMLPMWIGSGVFFSAERFPASVQPFLYLLPLTPLIDAMRSIMLEGTSLLALGPQLALILAWGCATCALALRWFRWN